MADLNGDSIDDLVIDDQYGSKEVQIFLGSRNGLVRTTLGEDLRIDVGSFDLGDVNEDGHVDLVARSSGRRTSTVTVLLGDGAGGFSFGSSLGVVMWGAGLALIDINEDGFLDVSTGASLFLGREGLEFDEPIPFPHFSVGRASRHGVGSDDRPLLVLWEQMEKGGYDVQTIVFENGEPTVESQFSSESKPRVIADVDVAYAVAIAVLGSQLDLKAFSVLLHQVFPSRKHLVFTHRWWNPTSGQVAQQPRQ
ncbi:MAG: VCBS repeat-containing protein, partial [Planctomycetota bacterium]